MKKILISLFLVSILFSCKKENDLTDDNLEYANFEISYQQSGDVDKINSVFALTSSEDIYQKGNNENLGRVVDLSSKVQGSKEKFSFTVKGRILVFTSATNLKEKYLSDESVNTKFTVKVLKNNKEIFNKTYSINKNNIEEKFQISLTAKD